MKNHKIKPSLSLPKVIVSIINELVIHIKRMYVYIKHLHKAKVKL